MTRTIFVFGSNMAGRHGAGAAKAALKEHGAIYGRGYGLQGDSYAIPTKDASLKSLDLDTILFYVELFIEFARDNPDLSFYLTPIGCGHAGYEPHQIAPMFMYAPFNIILPPAFIEILEEPDADA
jgi:hypothetical protein